MLVAFYGQKNKSLFNTYQIYILYAYPSGAPELVHPRFLAYYSIFSFMCMFCRSLFVFFLLAIVLSVLLPYTDSDYPFCIFKLFL